MFMPTMSLVAGLPLLVTNGVPTLGAASADDPADGKHFTATLSPVTAASGITRVIIDLPKEKVELADPRAEIYAAGDTLPSW